MKNFEQFGGAAPEEEKPKEETESSKMKKAMVSGMIAAIGFGVGAYEGIKKSESQPQEPTKIEMVKKVETGNKLTLEALKKYVADNNEFKDFTNDYKDEVNEKHVIIQDIDGDGVEDAAFIENFTALTGTMSMSKLNVLLQKPGMLEKVAQIDLGDRIDVKNLSFDGKNISVTYTERMGTYDLSRLFKVAKLGEKVYLDEEEPSTQK